MKSPSFFHQKTGSSKLDFLCIHIFFFYKINKVRNELASRIYGNWVIRYGYVAIVLFAATGDSLAHHVTILKRGQNIPT